MHVDTRSHDVASRRQRRRGSGLLLVASASESHQSTQAPGSRKRAASCAWVHAEMRAQAFAICASAGGSFGGGGAAGGFG